MNLRLCGVPAIDMEAGSDAIVFRFARSDHSGGRAMPLDRNESARDPKTGAELVMVKYPMMGGFVPVVNARGWSAASARGDRIRAWADARVSRGQ